MRALAEILSRIGGELAAAAGGAEIIGVALEGVAMRRRMRIDRHPANRVDDGVLRVATVAVMMRMAVSGVSGVHNRTFMPGSSVGILLTPIPGRGI